MVASRGEFTMTDSRFLDLGQVVLDDAFPDVDLALRRGRHVDRDDELWYAFLSDAQEHLEPFYARFGCDLVHRTDGYFYLLPTTEKLGRRHLGLSEMLVGQALTLLYLDPRTVQDGGVVTRGDVLGLLSAVMGPDALVHALSAKKKTRMDERVAQENVRARVAEAIRRLAGFGFVTLLEEERLRLRSALLRFAEPVRGEQSPREALEELLAKGEVVLHDEGSTFPSDDDTDGSQSEPFDDEPSEQDDDDLGDDVERDDLGDGEEYDAPNDGEQDDDDLGDGEERDARGDGEEHDAPDDGEETALSEGEEEQEATPFYEDELLDDELDGLQPPTNSDFDDDPDGFEESS